MKTYKVIILRAARRDLAALYDYLADEAGPLTAREYVERLEQACLSLRTFPHRGTKRDDIARGLRTIGFERRATIAFRVTGDEVAIGRLFYGGRDYERLLRLMPP